MPVQNGGMDPVDFHGEIRRQYCVEYRRLFAICFTTNRESVAAPGWEGQLSEEKDKPVALDADPF